MNAPVASTNGTKYALIWSANRWIGALEPCAVCTMRTIWASAVSRPTRVARNTNEPVVFRVAPITSSPGRFSSGIASPVSIDSSTAEAPSTTSPSTGIFSPGRTRSRSPAWTCSRGTSTSTSPRTTRADFAWSPISALTAPTVWPLARASSQRPSRISPTMMVELSK